MSLTLCRLAILRSEEYDSHAYTAAAMCAFMLFYFVTCGSLLSFAGAFFFSWVVRRCVREAEEWEKLSEGVEWDESGIQSANGW